jgi:hypothetical protein
MTKLHLLTGKDMAFDGAKRPKIPSSYPDGASTTILIVDSNMQVNWMQPVDLVVTQETFAPQPFADFRKLLGTKDGFLFLMGNSMVKRVAPTVSDQTLRAAITPHGRDVVGPDW